MRRILRPAMRQHVDQLEVGEGEDHRKQGDDQDDRLQQWQRDIAKALPATGAIDRRCLVKLRRYGLQTREQGDAVEGQAAPGALRGSDDRWRRWLAALSLC